MEFQVRVIGGIQSCFVSLPVHFIQTLEATNRGILPPVLALELRSRAGGCWHLAWSGSASTSTSIEIGQQLAECISLLDNTMVKVRAIANLPTATVVLVEPSTEDDWEILELNSELAEEAILEQVGVLYEGMRFPLWLQSHIVVEFLVVSTSPKSVVQLVPGSEVAVAPKRRKEHGHSYGVLGGETSAEEQLALKTLLRVQTPKAKQVHIFEGEDVRLGVVLTSAVFVHPKTAQDRSLDNFQSVKIFPRVEVTGKTQKKKHGDQERKSKSSVKESEDAPRHVFVQLLLSDAVAKGHVKLPESLRLYLGLGSHSWVYVEKCNAVPRKDPSLLTLSPCWFKLLEKEKINDTKSINMPDAQNIRRIKKPLNSSLIVTKSKFDLSFHKEAFHTLSNARPQSECEEEVDKKSYQGMWGKSLVQAWILGQLRAIVSEIGEMSFGSHDSYKISLKEGIERFNDPETLELALGKIELGEPMSFDSHDERSDWRNLTSKLSPPSWMETNFPDIIDRLWVVLSSDSCKLLSSLDLPRLGHVLIYGPSGSGKTSLAMGIARYFEEHEEILAHIVFVSCSKLSSNKNQTIRQALAKYISEALNHAPSLLIFDDLDTIISSASDAEGLQSSNSNSGLIEFLMGIMDEYGEKWQTSCSMGSLAIIASMKSLSNLPQSLRTSGMFDFHVELPPLAVLKRGALLKYEINKRSWQCSEDDVSEIASRCDGYDAHDLEILVGRAVHAAIGRMLSSKSASKGHVNSALTREDLLRAMHDFVPVAMRDITTSASKGGRTGWEDVGGLIDVRNAIQEMVELPSKFPNLFTNAPLRLRTNVLLYGPPGCGKTHIVGAAAAGCSLNFISVKGPELLNKYIGASEQAVRDVFSKAAAAAPCLLFFDEFDSIAPKRGHDNTGVTDRVVNQFLTELDGVEALTGVFVFAATSRPDLLDAALLRPGRLDRLLFCDFPSRHERLDILNVLSRKLPLASDVDLESIASITEGFSGADLQAVLSDAQLASVQEFVDNEVGDKTERMPVISNALIKSKASQARPSVSKAEKQRLFNIYNEFLDSKKSVAAQSRDAKGKRATLA